MAENFNFKDLTKDTIRKAFDETLKTFNEPGTKLVLLTDGYEEIALNFAREHFITEEPLYKGLGVTWTEEVEEYWKQSFKRNLCLLILSEKDEEVVAFLSIRISRSDDNNDWEDIADKPLKEVVRYVFYCDRKAQFHDHFQTEEAFHLVSLGVAPKYKQRGYATKIVQTSVDFIRKLGGDPIFLKAEGSAKFSQKIFERMNMEVLSEVFYDDLEVDGKKPFHNTGIHKSMKNYGIKLSP